MPRGLGHAAYSRTRRSHSPRQPPDVHRVLPVCRGTFQAPPAHGKDNRPRRGRPGAGARRARTSPRHPRACPRRRGSIPRNLAFRRNRDQVSARRQSRQPDHNACCSRPRLCAAPHKTWRFAERSRPAFRHRPRYPRNAHQAAARRSFLRAVPGRQVSPETPARSTALPLGAFRRLLARPR